VEQVEVFGLGHVRHLRRQGQRVGLVLEERVRHHLDFVEPDALAQLDEAGRQRRGDEVNRVSARRKLLAQLRADDAAAAVSRVDRDTDIHKSKGGQNVSRTLRFFD
jgi:hypothetical protein